MLKWILFAAIFGFMPREGSSTLCYFCLHIEEQNITSEECLAKNTTTVLDCEGPCVELTYEDPVSGNVVIFTLDCATEAMCTEEALSPTGMTTFNSSINGYTEHTRCCTEDYCNCDTDTCSSVAPSTNDTDLLECYYCSTIEGVNTSIECENGNAAGLLLCDGFCMDLSYEDSVTGYLVIVEKNCGSPELCFGDTLSEAGSVVYNSSFNNYTERIRCCTGNRCNCNSTDCLIEPSTDATTTKSTTAQTSYSEPILESLTHCFYCVHSSDANFTSEECINKEITDITLCNGSCITRSYENPGSGELSVFILSCGDEHLCNRESFTAEGSIVYNSSYLGYTERIQCCTENYCNCDTPTCLSAIDPSLVENKTTTAPSSTSISDDIMFSETIITTVMNKTATSSFASPEQNITEVVKCFSCKHAILEGVIQFACVENEISNVTECPGSTCLRQVIENLQQSEFALISYELKCGFNICNDNIADGDERVIYDPETNATERITCCKGDYCNCNTSTCLRAANISFDSTTLPLQTGSTLPVTSANTDIMTTKKEETTLNVFTDTQITTTDRIQTSEAGTTNSNTDDTSDTITFRPTNRQTTSASTSQDTTSESVSQSSSIPLETTLAMSTRVSIPPDTTRQGSNVPGESTLATSEGTATLKDTTSQSSSASSATPQQLTMASSDSTISRESTSSASQDTTTTAQRSKVTTEVITTTSASVKIYGSVFFILLAIFHATLHDNL